MNKAYFYQESNFYQEDTTFFDTLYHFQKGSSLFLDDYISVTSEPLLESTFRDLFDRMEVYKVSSVDLFAEEWQHSILPYIEQLMNRRKLPDTFISNAISIMEMEITISLKDADDVFISSVNKDYHDTASVEYLTIYIFNKTVKKDNPFVYYNFEI